jgi:hypothetical protein
MKIMRAMWCTLLWDNFRILNLPPKDMFPQALEIGELQEEEMQSPSMLSISLLEMIGTHITDLLDPLRWSNTDRVTKKWKPRQRLWSTILLPQGKEIEEEGEGWWCLLGTEEGKVDRGSTRALWPGELPAFLDQSRLTIPRDFIENRKAAQAFKARLQQNERDADGGRFFGGGGPSRHEEEDHSELSARELVKAKREKERELEMAEKERQVSAPSLSPSLLIFSHSSCWRSYAKPMRRLDRPRLAWKNNASVNITNKVALLEEGILVTCQLDTPPPSLFLLLTIG